MDAARVQNFKFRVGAGEDGSRIDRFLAQKSGRSRAAIKKLLNQGKVYVGSRRVFIAGWELHQGDEVDIRLAAIAGEKPPLEKLPRLKIHFEDRDLIVVEKPPGVLSEAKKDSPYFNIPSLVKAYLKRKSPGFRDSYVKTVHRLDRLASGLLIVAKSKVGCDLENQFRGRKVQKAYMAIVEGRVEKNKGVVRVPLVKSKGQALPRGGAGAKMAETRYQVIERYLNATFLEVETQTGRTHQIRVHMSALSHPILGDELYGSRFPAKRIALHASRISFRHPATSKVLEFDSSLPRFFEEWIEKLRAEA